MLDTAISLLVSLSRMLAESVADNTPVMFTVSKPEVVLYRADFMEGSGLSPTYVIIPVTFWAFVLFHIPVMPLGVMVTWRGSEIAAKSSCSVEFRYIVNAVSRDACVTLDTGISPPVPFSRMALTTKVSAGSSNVTFSMWDVTL